LEEFVNREIDGYCHNKILVVGHLTKAKGFTDIVKIIPTIAEEFPDVQFCFAGNIRRGERNVFFNQVTGEAIIYEDPIEVEKEILKSPYKKNYKNLGIITGNEKLKAFKDANIFITASYSEGFSRAMLEAMTMGKPLIYTPVGAHREVLENGVNGILINPGKPKELTNAIRKLLINRKLRNSIAKNNYDKARREFTIQKVAKDFKNIIHFEL
jgi:glycosyltransferase involved in cell wall biosynthesis